MQAALIKLLLPLAIRILVGIFAKVDNDKESKKQFLLFVDSMEREQLASVKLNDSDRAQVDELKRRRALLQRG